MNNLTPQRLFKTETLITVFSLLVSLSTIAQSSLASGKPNWLGNILTQTKEKPRNSFYRSAEAHVTSINYNSTVTSYTSTTPSDAYVSFDGVNDYMVSVDNSNSNNPLRRGYTGRPSSVTSGKTANGGQPWATAVVFTYEKSSGNSYIWSQTNGSTRNDAKVGLYVKSNDTLAFYYGTGYNYLRWESNAPLISGTKYAVYVDYNGGTTGNNSPPNKYYTRFRIKFVDLNTGTETNIPGTWYHKNYGFKDVIQGNFYVGGKYGSNKSFKGNVHSMIVTTLCQNVNLPSSTEITAMTLDPLAWLNDYKVGNPWRRPDESSYTSSFQVSTNDATQGAKGTKVWLMGDGTDDSYPFIKNQVSYNVPTQNLVMYNMAADDLATILKFTSSQTNTVLENTAYAYTAEATGGSGTITYSLAAGGDASLFTINSTSGEVSFTSLPDYEAPSDANADNVYVFDVIATDGNATTATQEVSITILADTDGDGIANSIDLDDDNDGISDIDEGDTLGGIELPYVLYTAAEFSGNREYLATVTSSSDVNLMHYKESNIKNPKSTGLTAEEGNPWMSSAWFQKLGAFSSYKEVIWAQSVGTGFYNGRVELSLENEKLIFHFGRGVAFLRWESDDSFFSGEWYNITVVYDGGTTGYNATEVNDYYSRFTFYKTNLEGQTSVLSGSWAKNGWGNNVPMNGITSIGARANNTNGTDYFEGRVAYFTTLALNTDAALPTTDEVQLFASDPLAHQSTYLTGKKRRYAKENETTPSSTVYSPNTSQASYVLQSYWMGDGQQPNESLSEIRNQAYYSNSSVLNSFKSIEHSSGVGQLVKSSESFLRDTDADGTPDHLDIDADGDGCYDVREAGFTDVDNDGKLDGTVDINTGKIIGADGYTTPLDSDTSGVQDYVEDSVLDNCLPTLVFEDIYKTENASNFTLNATTSNGATITYSIEGTNTTGTSLSGANNSTVSVGTEGTLTLRATAAASDFYVETYKEVTLYIYKDNDGDLVGDPIDLDDDNDGVLDTEEGDFLNGNQMPTILNTALDFDGVNDYLRTNCTGCGYNVMYFNNSSSSNPKSNGLTAERGYPWMSSVWFQKSGQHSADKEVVWSQTTGTNETNRRVELYLQNGKLHFTFGSSNNGLFWESDATFLSEKFYNITVVFDGGSTGVNSTEVNDYYSRFTLYSTTLAGEVSTLNGTWTNTGNGNNTTIAGYTTIGARGNFSSATNHFTGKIGYFAALALNTDTELPSIDEIKLFALDPLAHETTYLTGKKRRYSNYSTGSWVYSPNSPEAAYVLQSYWMGDGQQTNESYNQIRNQAYYLYDNPYFRLVSQNMQSDDLVDVSTAILRDTDNDGILDHLDADADGDGCFDVRESGFTDADNDGKLDGTIDLTNGKINGSGGYTTPLDSDASGVYDYIEASVLDDCLPIITFEDIYKTENAADFTLNATTSNGETITYSIEGTNSTGTTLSEVNNSSVSVGTEGSLTLRATVAASGFYVETYKEVTLYIHKDNDGDLVGDPIDLDDDNDGISDIEEGDFLNGNELPAILNTAIDFDGILEYLKTYNALSGNNMLHFETSGLLNPKTNGYTAESGYPWMSSVWFQKSGAYSMNKEVIWSQTMGQSETERKVELYLRNEKLHFTFGSSNNGLFWESDITLSADNWYNITVVYDGGTTGNNGADINDYYSRFTLYSTSLAGEVTELNGTWTSAGNGNNSDITGHTSFGGRSTNTTSAVNYFQGKIGYFAALALNTDTELPNTNEIKLFALDPLEHEATYLTGQSRKYCPQRGSSSGVSSVYTPNTSNAAKVLQSYWMGDGQQTNELYNQIKNQAIYSSSSEYYMLVSRNMQSDNLVDTSPSILRDTDNDGILDHLDLDSDEDGCFDVLEAGFTDSDNDGRLDGTVDINTGKIIGADGYTTPLDSDTSGIQDYVEDSVIIACLPDTDGDGIKDITDLDDDNDGILDTIESQGIDPTADADNDGIADYLDEDFGALNDNGIVVAFDFDGDGIPNHFDLDSDNDGIYDIVEAGGLDTDNNGIADNLEDLDEDGLVDIYDGDCTTPVIATTTGYVTGIQHESGFNNSTWAIGNDFTKWTNSQNEAAIRYIVLDFGLILPAGTEFTIYLGKRKSYTISGKVQKSNSNGDFLSGNKPFSLSSGNIDLDYNYTTTEALRYLIIDTDRDGLRIYAAEYTTPDIAGVDCSGTGLTPINTTASGNADFLNTDSDADGCYDVNEAGFTDADNDGIVDGSGYETNGSVSGSDGYTGTKTAVTDDNMVDTCLDTDGDGIYNNIDLDDDNDGILDTEEDEFIVIEASSSGEIDSYVGIDGNHNNISNGNTNDTGIIFDAVGDYMIIDLNGTATSGKILNGTTISIYVSKSNNDAKNLFISQLPSNTVVLGGGLDPLKINKNSLATNNDVYSIDYALTADTEFLQIEMRYNNGGSYNITEIVIGEQSYHNDIDTDNDSLVNRLDLDSDGDGCPDAKEAAVPAILQSSGVNSIDGITDNTENAIINTTEDPVGDNGFADSLETTKDNGIARDAFIAINYATYALDNGKNGCGIPIISQIYKDGSDTWVEVSNSSPDKIIVPNTFNINLFENSEIPDAKGEPVDLTFEDENVRTFPVNFDEDDIITISRNGSEMAAWDKAHGVKDKSSFVRKDQILTPNAEYDSNEWIEFKDDALLTKFDEFERHPHDPLLSEISADSNANEGVHNFGPVKIENCTEVCTGDDDTPECDKVCTWKNGKPDRSRTVIINENYTHSGNTLSADKLEIKGNNILSVKNQLLLVTNEVNIKTGAEIRLIGTSQLIQTHEGTAKVTGDGKIYIDQNSDIESVYRYNYMSSPVTTNEAKSTYTIASAFKDGTTPLNATDAIGETIAKDLSFTGNWDGKIENGSPYISTRWIYTFAPAAGNMSNWIRQGKDGAIKATDGFIFKGPGVAQNYTFAGSPNDGKLITNIGANQSYLVGNPFSSALNGIKFIHDNQNSIVGTLYFWDHVGEKDSESSDIAGHYQSGYIGGYATLNLSGKIAAYQYISDQDDEYSYKTPGTYIPVGQGFYVGGNSDGGAITFNNSQREFVGEVHKDSLQGGLNNSIFFKSGKKKIQNSTANGRYYGSLPIVKLGMNALNQNDGKTYHRQIGVSFKENNSFAYDNGYDSEMFDTRATDFYWKFPEDDRNYVIAGVQAFYKEIEVPLEIVIEHTTDITIMIDDVKNIDSNIYLIDKTTGISHEITEDNAHLSLEPGTYTDRFALAFEPSTALSMDNEIINLSTNIYVDNKNHHLIVTKDYDLDIKKVVLYTILGKTISTWKINEHADSYQLALKPGLPAGVYISKITTNKGTNNKKIIIE